MSNIQFVGIEVVQILQFRKITALTLDFYGNYAINIYLHCTCHFNIISMQFHVYLSIQCT